MAGLTQSPYPIGCDTDTILMILDLFWDPDDHGLSLLEKFTHATLNSFYSRMLKKSASFVLAALRGSTYRSVRLASSLAAALRAAFLSILRMRSSLVPGVQAIDALLYRNGFSATCYAMLAKMHGLAHTKWTVRAGLV
jgi:hypothetical protein